MVVACCRGNAVMKYDPRHYREVTAENQIWMECSESDYQYGLECLPPAVWIGDTFMVGEPMSHTDKGAATFTAYLKRDGKFYCGKQPMTVKEFRRVKLAEINIGVVLVVSQRELTLIRVGMLSRLTQLNKMQRAVKQDGELIDVIKKSYDESKELLNGKLWDAVREFKEAGSC